MKCETPARERGSSRDPVAIQSPMATDRTPGRRSLMMRSPPGRVVASCPGTAAIVSMAVPERLPPREAEVLRLLAQGFAAESIADRHVISRKTVSSHLQRVMGKLGVHTRAQAVAEAYRIGLVTGDFEAHALDAAKDEGRLAPPPVSLR